MKTLLFCLSLLMLLSGCASPVEKAPAILPDEAMETDFEAIVAAVEDLLTDRDLPAVTEGEGAAAAADCYGFKAEALHDGWVRSSSYALQSFEIALFHARSEANVTIIAEKLRTYLGDLEAKYALAAPAAASRIRQAELITHGTFCALIVCEPGLQSELVSLINAEISD